MRGYRVTTGIFLAIALPVGSADRLRGWIAPGVNDLGPPLTVEFMAIAFAVEQLFQ